MSPVTTSAFTEALVADSVTPVHPNRMRAFARLVGSWDVTGRRLDEKTGEWRERRFTWIVAYILEGRALQDLEVVEREDGPETVATAVRVYDPDAGVWRVSYFSPSTGDYCNLVATAYRDDIRQDGSQTDERPIRWNFSEITEDSYVWDAWVSNDDGATWAHVEHNEGTRLS